jgi:hypothetical protein
MKSGWLKIAILVVSLIAARFIARGPSYRRIVALGLILVVFFAAQARSIFEVYRHTSLYQRRNAMALSDLEILEIHYDGRLFGGKRVLPLLVADHMPRAKVFLNDETAYTKSFLGWSGRDPETTFVIGGYEPTMSPAFRSACLRRPHVVHDGVYIATPLSTYESEKEVFLMHDGLINYLIPGSWRIPSHE